MAIDIVCGTCGSKNVSRDAWADWDVHTQDWVLGAVFDYAHCHHCDCETRLEEIEVEIERAQEAILQGQSKEPDA